VARQQEEQRQRDAPASARVRGRPRKGHSAGNPCRVPNCATAQKVFCLYYRRVKCAHPCDARHLRAEAHALKTLDTLHMCLLLLCATGCARSTCAPRRCCSRASPAASAKCASPAPAWPRLHARTHASLPDASRALLPAFFSPPCAGADATACSRCRSSRPPSAPASAR
jgi:hypothetical protein